jgi:hypothetical protein
MEEESIHILFMLRGPRDPLWKYSETLRLDLIIGRVTRAFGSK